jgi:hypothetical protein
VNSSTTSSSPAPTKGYAKGYARAMIAGAFLLLAGTVAANVISDPEHVFNTGLFPVGINRNERVETFERYKREASSVDALIFSSSRGILFDHQILQDDMGAKHLLSLSVSYGMITDHLPIFEYILKDKAARGQSIKSVLLLLDVDFFGKQPWTNSNINSFLPPELSGEAPVRYWWRYLTAFQYRLWRDIMKLDLVVAAKADTKIPAIDHAPIPLHAEVWRKAWNSQRPDLERQLRLLKQFVALCKENGVTLHVAISPMIRQNIDAHEPEMLRDLTDQLSAIVPLWDFNSPAVLADRRDYWMDFSHFTAEAGTLMLNRIYTRGESPIAGLGRYVGANSQEKSADPIPGR